MFNFNAFLDFVLKNFVYIYIAIAGVLALFGAVNLLTNVYRKDAKRLSRATKLLSKDKDSFAFVAELPYAYRYMWQVYVLGRDIYPRDAIRFIKNKQHRYGVILSAAAVIFGMLVAVAGVAKGKNNALMLFGGGGFALVYGILLVLIKLKEKAQEKQCSLILAKLVLGLDAVYGKNTGQVKVVGEIDEKATDELIEKIKFLRENGVPGANAQKIASLLASEKLSQPRTVEQQKKLNEALNGLVQVMSYTTKSPNS